MSNPISDLKHELLAAAERQYTTVPAEPRRFGGRVFALRPLLVAATVAAAAAAALVFTIPWKSSPSFLAQAEAALTPPEGTILHAKLAETSSRDPIGCARSFRSRKSATWTADFWVDERTHRFRGLFRDPCMPGRPDEQGFVSVPNYLSGWFSGVVRFVPPNDLVAGPLMGGGPAPSLDPVRELRSAIRAGRAHDEGRTQLNGRTVERIRIDPCDWIPGCPDLEESVGGGYAYVDPKTFYPVELRRAGDVTRFETFEYLPRSAANVALTNIRAQHPYANGPWPGTIELQPTSR